MSNDEEIIRAKMNTLNSIFRNPERKLFEDLFTPDCDYITFLGQHLKGIEENYRVHKNLANIWLFKGAELVIVDMLYKLLNEFTAVVITKGAIKLRWQKKIKTNRMSINTNIFVKQSNEWKLASFQNTRIKKPGFLMRLFSR